MALLFAGRDSGNWLFAVTPQGSYVFAKGVICLNRVLIFLFRC